MGVLTAIIGQGRIGLNDCLLVVLTGKKNANFGIEPLDTNVPYDYSSVMQYGLSVGILFFFFLAVLNYEFSV